MSLAVSVLTILGLLLCGLPTICQVEAQEGGLGEAGARWSIAFLLGPTGTGPSGDFKEALVQGGYDDPSPGGIFSPAPPIPHPSSPSAGAGWEIELGYRLSSKMILAISAGRTEFGTTTGYKESIEQGAFGEYVNLFSSAKFVFPSLVYRIRGVLASVGPSLVQARTQVSGSGERDDQDGIRIGATAGVGYAWKLWRSLNLEFRARYRLVGSMKMGPFDQRDGVVPQVRASFNHWQVGAGFGLDLNL